MLVADNSIGLYYYSTHSRSHTQIETRGNRRKANPKNHENRLVVSLRFRFPPPLCGEEDGLRGFRQRRRQQQQRTTESDNGSNYGVRSIQ